MVRVRNHLPSDECFKYIYDHANEGWKLEAIPGVTKFKCEKLFRGLPVVSLANTFADYKEKDIDLSEMDTSNIINMQSTFVNCQAENIDLSSFNFKEVKSMKNMFYGSNVKRITFGENKVAPNLFSIEMAFYCCYSLESIDISGLEADNLEIINCLFCGDTLLKYIDMRRIKLDNEKLKNNPGTIPLLWMNNNSIRCIIVSDSNIYKESVIGSIENIQIVRCKESAIENIMNKLNLISSDPVMLMLTDI